MTTRTAGDPHGLADLPDPLAVAPIGHELSGTAEVPGSKSITNRALVCAALARGRSTLTGALISDDTEAMAGVLSTVGIASSTEGTTIVVDGCRGRVPAAASPIHVRQSGTTSRFTLPLLALGQGRYEVDAHPQMRARPMESTFEALAHLGTQVEATTPGYLPATVLPGPQASSSVTVAGDVSSQFLSGLLLTAPSLPEGLTIHVQTPLVSRPYVDLTVHVMEVFGAHVDQPDDATFVVHPTGYQGTDYAIEPDASAASYPLAAAMICGGRVRVSGLGTRSLQGDAAFAEVLAQMGATVTRTASETTVERRGVPITGGTFDFTHISDTAQTLAVVAPFADSPVTITGIDFIRRKEIDRIAAVTTELRRCGVRVDEDPDGWTIHPSAVQPATVETYDDHRMAMSFALLGLVAPGIEVAGPACVAKTFPGYWDLLESLRTGEPAR